jgi:hypothetical protein
METVDDGIEGELLVPGAPILRTRRRSAAPEVLSDLEADRHATRGRARTTGLAL